jgi:signal transduction histidine kinase
MFDHQDEDQNSSSDTRSSSVQETKVVSGPDVMPLAIGFLQRSASSFLRVSTNRSIPKDRKASLDFLKALFDSSPNFKYQIITDIEPDNVEYYESLVKIGVEVRHIDKNKISFAFSKDEYMTTELALLEEQSVSGALVPKEVVWSTRSDAVSQANQIFQMMWQMSTSAEVRIYQLKSGEMSGETRLISDMSEVFRIGRDMTERCCESALLILASPKTVIRNSRMFERLTELQRERHFIIRVLSPDVEASAVKILPGAEWRRIEPMNVSITIYDMKDMFITQYEDTEANSTESAVFSNIYTTNQHTIAGMASVFDALWKESELREMEERSRKQAQLLQDILTHDIRNYNQISKLSGELVLERLKASGDEEGSRLVEDLLEAVDGASALAEKGKKLGKILSEENAKLSPVDPITSLQRSITLVRQAFPEKMIREDTKVLPGKIFVMADDLLDEVFTNIFSNSAKYNESSTVTIQIKMSIEGHFLKIIISDDGTGIADEIKDKIFERFVAGARGSGLGMSIIHALVVNRYRGQVSVENRSKGAGATVTVLLPLSTSDIE